MTETKPGSAKLPYWMLELLTTVKSLTFIAEDEELLVDCCLMSTPIMYEAEASFDKLEQLDDEGEFTIELNKLIKHKWKGTKRGLCEKALLLENTFYKIQAGNRQPGRDTIISLSLALGLSRAEAQRLLGYLGYGLSDHIKRDYIILRCLELGKKPVEVNLLFESCGLRLLGPNE